MAKSMKAWVFAGLLGAAAMAVPVAAQDAEVGRVLYK